ncbi:MAG: U32 family peptidase [Angelakisella sp.]
MGVDAAIVSDIGVLMAAHGCAGAGAAYLTQAGVTNWLTAAELHRLGPNGWCWPGAAAD